MLKKFFCVKYLFRHVKDNHSNSLQAGNMRNLFKVNNNETNGLMISGEIAIKSVIINVKIK